MVFEVTNSQEEKLYQWRKEMYVKYGKHVEYVYIFDARSGIGVGLTVRSTNFEGEEINLTNVENW